MAGYIVNAAPLVVDLGTQDLSTRRLPRETDNVPQHLPKFYLFTRKGPTTPQLVVGTERTNMYGSESFDDRSAYATHATVFANLVNAEGNSCIIERIIPNDSGPESNMILYMDVLPTTVDLYQRNIDGSIKLDTLGSPIITGTAPGYKVKWVKRTRATVDAMTDYGKATILPGSQTDPVTGTQSQLYPIFEFKASSRGEYGNNCGLRIWPVNKKVVVLPPNRMMASERAFPYYVQAIRRDTPNSTVKTVPTIFSEENFLVTFKPDTSDPLIEKRLYMGDIFIDAYNRPYDDQYPPTYGDIGSMVIYGANLKAMHDMLHVTEKAFIDGFSDFTVDPEDAYLVNIINGTTAAGTPYHSVHFVDDSESIRFSEYSNIMMESGSDGSMTDQVLADAVVEKMAEYLDPNSVIMDNAYNVESIFYDSGFPIDTKFELCNFIANRKDTFVVLSTYDVNDRVLSPSEEHSLAIALRTRLQMFPESDYFGTPVMRGLVMGRSGRIRGSKYTKRLPLTAELAIKSARYMGASNGKWRSGYNFDGAPGSVINSMTDVSHTWVPVSIRNRNWDVGLNWAQSYDRRSNFFPALKTVYNDDTSVLNSYFTAVAICYLNKIAHAAWREFSGVSHLTDKQLDERVNSYVNARVADKFDDRFVIIPDAHHTDIDVLRGTSWTLPIKIYAANMKTVMTTYVQSYRISDIQQAS